MDNAKKPLPLERGCIEFDALLKENRRLKIELEKYRDATEFAGRGDFGNWPYGLMVENSLTGMYVIQDGKIVFANDRFAEMFGYRRDEVLGLDSLTLVPPEDRKTLLDFRKKRLNKSYAPSEYEIRGLKKNGDIIWTVRRNVLIQYMGKSAILGNAVEISERKNMEYRLKKSQEILRFLSTQLLQAQENERKRIARELHDTIAQNLTGIKFYLSQKLDIYKEDKQLVKETLEPAVEMAKRSIYEVRRLINDLRPSCIDDLGILATIRWHCGQFEQRNPGVAIRRNLHIVESDVPDHLKVVIYRLLQESLNNVEKHSGANKVILEIKKQVEKLIFILEDNGCGFDAKNAFSLRQQPDAGWGLIGMKERTELSGGIFSIHSSVAKGARVTASWAC